ncbi:acyl-CoA dehydrogenase family protein [Streptomyces reniochalinae]|uniref:Acyl-CoA dehydrogenase n=1 Tax=Streptomyces reniochalinae TaxID=2250578 RepID=A0A367EGV9_9ACTN|nr:acyl-CoA dehydrogenase family protein [Streptomyces reniochalinae]RCG16999.1 acyl-CoA dehydrogenase [Streptomyces reniochalinae]
MDFRPTEEQTAARDLAAGIIDDLATHERLTALGTGTDPVLWKTLSGAGLLAAVEEIGLVGLALVLEEQGRRTAQIPLAATCAFGLLPVAAYGTDAQRARLLPGLRDGTAVATGALPSFLGASSTGASLSGALSPGAPCARAGRSAEEAPAPRAETSGRLSGVMPVVPWLRTATHVLVPVRQDSVGAPRLFLVPTDQPTVDVATVETTAPWAAGRLELSGALGEPLEGGRGVRHGGVYEGTLGAARTVFAALQAGVCAGSLAHAVAHTSQREQFGRPLSANQAVQLRAADAHLDIEAIRVTCLEAAWRYDAGLPAHTQALSAAWWAAEAGRRVVHTGQHLHGGVGADVTHPVHRHFLWGRQLNAFLGSPGALLAELGEALAVPARDAEWKEER